MGTEIQRQTDGDSYRERQTDRQTDRQTKRVKDLSESVTLTRKIQN